MNNTRNYNGFTKKYSVSKTLRFDLKPIGATQRWFDERQILANDKGRLLLSEEVKGYMDRYHREHINKMLTNTHIDGVAEYAEIYYKSDKSETDVLAMQSIEQRMRAQIAETITNVADFKKFFAAGMITDILPKYLTDLGELQNVAKFKGYTTYFTSFFNTREHLYTKEQKPNTVVYRCIDENLPIFLDNVRNFVRIQNKLQANITQMSEAFKGVVSVDVEDVFDIDYFDFVLSQAGITAYNTVLGGYTLEDGTVVMGINQYVNQYNQRVTPAEKLPLLKPLYKQILSVTEGYSYTLKMFENDTDVLSAVNTFYKTQETNFNDICNLFNQFVYVNDYNTAGIYVNKKDVTRFSHAVFGKWSAVRDGWMHEYTQTVPVSSTKYLEKYCEKQKKAYESIQSFAVSDICKYGAISGCNVDVHKVISETVSNIVNSIQSKYADLKDVLSTEYKCEKSLCNNIALIEQLKAFLDDIVALKRYMTMFLGTGKETDKNDSFYVKFSEYYDKLRTFENERLYDKVRNYITARNKPKNKVQLYFDTPALLSGWDRNKECDNGGVLLCKDGKYYLAITDKGSRKYFEKSVNPVSVDDTITRIVYKQIAEASKYFSCKQIFPQNPPENIRKYLSKGFNKKSMTKAQLVELIKYIVEDFVPKYKPIHDENGKLYFDYKFKAYEDYASWDDFMSDIGEQSYSIGYKEISYDYVMRGVENGDVYLYQIYNKDFSEYSHGTDNLHTMYFKELFAKDNLNNVVYKLNGGAAMYFQQATLNVNDVVKHPANIAVRNKRPLNDKAVSVFPYDIIKDKHYTTDHFKLYIPITMNYNAPKAQYTNINYEVRDVIKRSDENYIIGIDRGIRNLLYACVINSHGEIVEQVALNKVGHTDYQTILTEVAKMRDTERKNWLEIDNIKNIKEGYIGQAVHKICQLAVKYNAIIALEDLDCKFKRNQLKYEQQVYQKFETALLTKMQYVVDKQQTDLRAEGGLLNAYQLTNGKAMNGKQNGFVFFVAPYYTSAIDPVTGFVDLFKHKYKNIETAKELIRNFESIKYNKETDMFEFTFKYSKVCPNSISVRDEWTVCTNGERILKCLDAQYQPTASVINLTEGFKVLFEMYAIDINGDIKNAILCQTDKHFYATFLRFFMLTVQLRNSMPGDIGVDYIISPVRNEDGVFYDSRDYENIENAKLPVNADANGAYNIARKALWIVEQIKASDGDDLYKVKFAMKNTEWLAYAQT